MRNIIQRLKGTTDDHSISELPSLPPLPADEEPAPARVRTPGPPSYPIGVPSKFDLDGNVQRFPGNTIVAHLSPDGEFYASLLELHAKLAASPLAPLFALLPPESWHMTIFEGVCDSVRGPGAWPRDLPPDVPLEQCTAHFAQKLDRFALGAAGSPPYHVTATGFSSFFVGIVVRLRMRTAAEEARLRGLRDRLADELQIRASHHDHYELHLSLAYFLRYLDNGQKQALTALLMGHFAGMPKEFELGAPEFCTFENMYKFDQLFYLR